MFAITKNGKGQYIVPSYSTIADELIIATLNTSTMETGTKVGELIRFDEDGNRWSVRRVTPRQANAINSARKARQERLYQQWKANRKLERTGESRQASYATL